MMITVNHNRPQCPSTLGEKQKAITGRDYISYSEVATYQKCPLQWRFRYVDNAEPEEISAALILGSGVHAAIEHHFQAIISAGVLPTVDALLQVFDTCWDREAAKLPVSFPKGQDRDTIRATAERMIRQFLDSPHATPEGRLIGIEQSFRVRLAEDLPTLLGSIDLVTWDGKQLLITDFKTARSLWSPTTAQENAEQLMLYSIGMQDLAKTLSEDARIALRFVIVTKTKEPKIESLPVKPDPDRLHRTRLTVRNVVASMQQASQADTLYPSPSQFNCATCPYTKRCKGWHRRVG